MKHTVFILLAMMLYTGCKKDELLSNDDFEVLDDEKYFYRLIQLYPILATDKFLEKNRGLGEYFTLHEALTMKMIEITEIIDTTDLLGIYGDIHHLLARNISSDTIFIMHGELISGGLQDRIIIDDYLLAPSGRQDTLNVICIEKKRWEFLSPTKSNFEKTNGAIENDIRKISFSDRQQMVVWQHVDASLGNVDVNSFSLNYNDLFYSPEIDLKLSSYGEHYDSIFKSDDRIVGFMAMSGNYFLGCEIFCSNDLFRREFRQLFTAYTLNLKTRTDFDALDDVQIEERFRYVMEEYHQPAGSTSKLMHAGRVIHFVSL